DRSASHFPRRARRPCPCFAGTRSSAVRGRDRRERPRAQGRGGELMSRAVAVEPVISIRHLTIRFGATAVVRDVSLDIPRHSLLGIIGPAQSGKTTLLRTLNRLDAALP